MTLRTTKALAVKAAIQLTPQYSDWIIELKKGPTQSFHSNEIAHIQNNLGNYVLMYDDERKIGASLFLSIMGDEGLKEFNSEIKQLTEDQQQKWIDDISNTEKNELVEAFSSIEIPETPEDWQAARDELAKLPDDERKEAEKRGAYFWCFAFSSFFNTLSLMVHGARLTTLVPQAIAGNKDAYLKAIQIDRMLLLHYPYFRDRKFRAQDERDIDFLSKINYRESNSPIRGKIQYPALYMLFGILDSFRWLDDLKREEILDICDEAGLDRYQNRIEDLGYLNKRLSEYRKWQKTGGVSMH
jgi:hypothetical protein